MRTVFNCLYNYFQISVKSDHLVSSLARQAALYFDWLINLLIELPGARRRGDQMVGLLEFRLPIPWSFWVVRTHTSVNDQYDILD
jgi:hypothetical protein